MVKASFPTNEMTVSRPDASTSSSKRWSFSGNGSIPPTFNCSASSLEGGNGMVLVGPLELLVAESIGLKADW